MQTKLAAEATKLSRTIFASLPWGFRLAHLFEKFAVDTQEAFGRFAYAEFLKAGVEGLPDINGQPALSLRGEIQGPRAADKLPRGYGKDFGKKVWTFAFHKFRDMELVEDGISHVMMRMVKGEVQVREGSTLKSAENLIVTSVLNATMDALRAKKRAAPSLMRENDEDGYAEIDIADPHAFKELEQMLPRSEMARLMNDLKSIQDRAPSWVEAQLDGLTDRELATEWGTTPSYLINWKKRYLEEIHEVIRRHLHAVAA